MKQALKEAEKSKSEEIATVTQALQEAEKSSSKNEAELAKSKQAFATQAIQNLDA